MTAKSNRQLTYLDSNVKTGAEMSAEERIQVALTMGICPICGHSLTEEEFKDVSEAAAAFYASQH